jgi:hypothetical protein
MDLTYMVWFVRIFLAAQWHNKGGLERHLKVGASSHGGEIVVPFAMRNIVFSKTKVWLDNRQAWGQVFKKMRIQDAVEWCVADDLRGQSVLAALA